jgi:hypothetical protein
LEAIEPPAPISIVSQAKIPVAPAVSANNPVQVQQVGSSEEEEGALAAIPAAPQENSTSTDDEAPWPSDTAESSAMAGNQEQPIRVSSATDDEGMEEDIKKGLPPLSQLLDKLPAELKETLDDLFRARWTRVTRVKGKALK